MRVDEYGEVNRPYTTPNPFADAWAAVNRLPSLNTPVPNDPTTRQPGSGLGAMTSPQAREPDRIIGPNVVTERMLRAYPMRPGVGEYTNAYQNQQRPEPTLAEQEQARQRRTLLALMRRLRGQSPNVGQPAPSMSLDGSASLPPTIVAILRGGV